MDCPVSDTIVLTSPCKCAHSSTTNECPAGHYCWTTNQCVENLKPTPCVIDDTTWLKEDCQCSESSTTAECQVGKFCVTGYICQDAADTGGDGTCPAVTVQQSFNVTEWARTRWYAHQQMEIDYQPVTENYCVTAQ